MIKHDKIDDGGALQSTNVGDIHMSLNRRYAHFMLSLKKVYQLRITTLETISNHYQLLSNLQSEYHEKKVHAILDKRKLSKSDISNVKAALKENCLDNVRKEVKSSYTQ